MIIVFDPILSKTSGTSGTSGEHEFTKPYPRQHPARSAVITKPEIVMLPHFGRIVFPTLA